MKTFNSNRVLPVFLLASTCLFPISDFGLTSAQAADLFVGKPTTGETHTVSGDESFTSLYVGHFPDEIGTVNIGAGTTLTTGVGDTVVGDVSNATGHVFVSGAGSKWTAKGNAEGWNYLGYAGAATIDISNQGSVVLERAWLAHEAGSSATVTVSGNNSSLKINRDILVGYSGTADISVSNGAAFDSGLIYIGGWPYAADDTGSGSLLVTGAGTTWNAQGVHVGRGGGAQASLTVSDGSSVSIAGGFYGGKNATIKFTGPGTKVIIGDQNDVNSTNWFSFDGGNITVDKGAYLFSDGGYIGTGGTSLAHVTVTGKDTIWDTTKRIYVGGKDGGPGDGNGKLTIADGASVSSATIGAGLDGASTGVINITGSNTSVHAKAVATIGPGNFYVAYAGKGTVTLSDDASLTVDNELRVATAAGSTGTLIIGAAKGASAIKAGRVTAPKLVFGAGDGTLIFNHTNKAYEFGADISGKGSIELLSGETHLTGTNSYTGGTTVSGGTLIGDTNSLTGDITNNAALEFNQGSNGTFAGTISGSGALTKSGTGQLILTGTNTYTGGTTVSGGRLIVNGSITGNVTTTGGTLGGSGTTGAITVASGGTVAPGNSVGTLNVTNANLAAGSTYEVELNDGGFVAGTNSDLINATGTATINGGTVNVSAENGTDNGPTYLAGRYTLIKAAGGVTGTFDSITDNYLFLDFVLGYDANTVYLDSTRVAQLTDFAQTRNQLATAFAADKLVPPGTAIVNSILGLSTAAQARGAFDALSGEIHASAKSALIEDSRFARNLAIERARGASDLVQGESYGIWGQAYGASSHWGSDGNAAAMDQQGGGFLVGMDGALGDTIRLGLMAGIGHTTFSVDDRASSGSADNYTIGAYAGSNWGGIGLRGGIAQSWHNLDISRSASFTGYSDSLAARYNAQTLQVFGEGSFAINTHVATFEPFAGLSHVRLKTDGYSETGGTAALSAAASTQAVTFSILGLRARKTLTSAGRNISLTGGIGWRHAFGDVTPNTSHGFASGGMFTVGGVPVAQDMLMSDFGVDIALSDSATLSASYNGQFSSDVITHTVKAKLGIKF